MVREVDRVIRTAAERLAQATGAEAIILFGSRARGDNSPDSDWDLCVVLPDDIEPQQFTPSKLWKIVADLNAGIQVYPIRRSVLEAKKDDPNSVSHDIAKEGLIILGELHSSIYADSVQ